MNTNSLEANARPGVNAAQQKCLVCNKEIMDGYWFCRIPRKEEPAVVLCSPKCALRYFDSLCQKTTATEIERAAYERDLHSLAPANGQAFEAAVTRLPRSDATGTSRSNPGNLLKNYA